MDVKPFTGMKKTDRHSCWRWMTFIVDITGSFMPIASWTITIICWWRRRREICPSACAPSVRIDVAFSDLTL